MNTRGAGKIQFKPIYIVYILIVLVALFVLYELTKINNSTYVIGK
jgi:hypothetical protein